MTTFGAKAPARTATKAAATRDDKAGPSVDLIEVRLTVSRIFNSDLYDRVAAKSWCLPAIILPATLVPRIVRTSGSVVYRDEATCIVRIRSDASAAFLTTPMPQGAFVQAHTAKGKRLEPAPGTRIQWVERPQGATADQYLAHAKSIARDCGARVCYREGGNMCIGIA